MTGRRLLPHLVVLVLIGTATAHGQGSIDTTRDQALAGKAAIEAAIGAPFRVPLVDQAAIRLSEALQLVPLEQATAYLLVHSAPSPTVCSAYSCMAAARNPGRLRAVSNVTDSSISARSAGGRPTTYSPACATGSRWKIRNARPRICPPWSSMVGESHHDTIRKANPSCGRSGSRSRASRHAMKAMP